MQTCFVDDGSGNRKGSVGDLIKKQKRNFGKGGMNYMRVLYLQGQAL